MRHASLFILFFSFFSMTHLYGDYHVSSGNEPPRDRIQEALERCNVTSGPSPQIQQQLLRELMQKISLRDACSPVYYHDGVMITQSSEGIVKSFCAHPSTQKYMHFVDWSTPESSMKTVLTLRNRIYEYHGLRKNYVRNGANLGRASNYFDDVLDEYTNQLKLIVEQRRVQKVQEQRKKNYKEILQAHRSQALGGENGAKKKLVDYGEKLVSSIDTNSAARERLDNVVKTLQNNGAVREKRYQTDVEPFEQFSGNELQHYFHEQVVENYAKCFVIPPGDVKRLATGSVKCAYAANISHEYELADAALGFTGSLRYFVKCAGRGFMKGGIDLRCAVAYLLGEGELPSDMSSIIEIFAKIQEQPLEGIGDGLEYVVRMVTFGGAIFVSCLLGMEVAVAGATAAKGFVEALKFLKPFSIAVSPSGAATLEYSLASAKDFVQASIVALGQAARGVHSIVEQCGHLFAAGSGGGPPGGNGKSAFEIAKRGGKHNGFLKNYEDRPLKEIESGIKSLKKQIFKHQDCIRNPTKYYPDFYTFDPRRQKHLIEIKWPQDIVRQLEHLDILIELSKLKK